MTDAIWRNIFYAFFGFFLIVFGYLVISDRDGQVLTLIAASVCLLASRFNDVIKFKLSGSGLEGEMREVLQEARATVSQLHLLAEELSKSILWSMQAHGRFGGTSSENQNKMRDRVIETLKSLGVGERKISEVVAVEYPYIDFDYATYVTMPIRSQLQGEERQKWNTFFSADKRKGIGYEPKPDELEDFLRSVNLLDGDTKERLEDYRYFLRHRAHRRPEQWNNRLEQS